MNRNCCGVWTVIALAIVVAFFCPPAEAEEEEAIMIFGTVVGSDTDGDGNIIAIDLETHEGTYSIVLSGAGAELISYVGQAVEIEGLVTENDDGWAYIEVLYFSPVLDLM